MKTLLPIVAVLGAMTVMLGAFGAHFLKQHLTDSALDIFKTGVQYQFYHILAALFTLLLAQKVPRKRIVWIVRFFLMGILFFSGSLYLLSTADIIGIENLALVGPLTPLGGVCFIVGWGILAWTGFQNRQQFLRSLP